MGAPCLRKGYDVVVPQLLARPEFIEVLETVAREVGAEFQEVLLVADGDDVLDRFRTRRAALQASRVTHPERSVHHDARTVAAIEKELEGDRRRPSRHSRRAYGDE